jgi:hypothetical protein
MGDIVCNLELENLNKGGKCANNSCGVKTVYYALKEDVKVMPTLPNTRTSFDTFVDLTEGGVMVGTKPSIEMKPGKRMFQFYCGRELGELKYSIVGGVGSKCLQANLEVMHPGCKDKIIGFVKATANDELIILCKLNNGDIHVLGDLELGAELGDSAEITSGKAMGDTSGATLNFTYAPAGFIYVGDMDSLLQVGSGSGN